MSIRGTAADESASSAPWFAAPPVREARSAVIIGAGIAGCSIAYALGKRGLSVTLLDGECEAAARASGNTRCLVRPHLSRKATLHNLFNQQAFERTWQIVQELWSAGYEVEAARPGVLQLLEKIGLWEQPGNARTMDAETASELAGVRLQSPAMHFPDAGWINGRSFCRALLKAAPRTSLLRSTQARAFTRLDTGWRIQCKGNTPASLDTELLIVASGPACSQFDQLAFLDLTLSAGQTTRCQYQADAPIAQTVLAGKRYLIPDAEQCVVGSTHWRNCEDLAPSRQDNWNNLAALAHINAELPAQLTPVGHWRDLRASTPDRLPLIGAVPDIAYFKQTYTGLRHGMKYKAWPGARYLEGLYVITGLGSRGFTTASLGAELLADQITGQQPANENALAFNHLVHTARFLVRRLKRQQSA